ncbi:metallophosphoesterase [Candidatus Woesearchaeota archaeon]|nr:metallophosphoesterase [Candidatus Woesearchaeota archaeon]
MNTISIDKDLFLIGPGVLYRDTLIMSDIHIGYEEALNKQGVLMPRISYELIKNTAREIIRLAERNARINRIVINGDLKHEFGTISKQEWRQCLDFLDYLTSISSVVLVKGNHDTIIGPIADKKNVRVVEELRINDMLIIHGHRKPENMEKVGIIIIGHEHPAISVKHGERREAYKAFLDLDYKNKRLIVMPSMFPLIIGNDLLKEKPLSPLLLETNLDSARVFLLDNEYNIYPMGDIKTIRTSSLD